MNTQSFVTVIINIFTVIIKIYFVEKNNILKMLDYLLKLRLT